MKLLAIGIFFINIFILIYSYMYKVSGINRVLITLPRAVLETSIPLVTQEENITLFYDQELVKKHYESYLEKELKKYTNSYTVEYYFYNTKDGGYCDITNCQGVSITVEAKVMLEMKYKRVMKYEITESKINGKKFNN